MRYDAFLTIQALDEINSKWIALNPGFNFSTHLHRDLFTLQSNVIRLTGAVTLGLQPQPGNSGKRDVHIKGVSLPCSQKAEGGCARRHNNMRTIPLVPLASLDLPTRDRRVAFGSDEASDPL